jgi:hypothetical protein
MGGNGLGYLNQEPKLITAANQLLAGEERWSVQHGNDPSNWRLGSRYLF